MIQAKNNGFASVNIVMKITNTMLDGTNPKNVNLVMQIMGDFKSSLNDTSSLDYANLTQRIQNHVIFCFVLVREFISMLINL